jgi:hypothetical protein
VYILETRRLVAVANGEDRGDVCKEAAVYPLRLRATESKVEAKRTTGGMGGQCVVSRSDEEAGAAPRTPEVKPTTGGVRGHCVMLRPCEEAGAVVQIVQTWGHGRWRGFRCRKSLSFFLSRVHKYISTRSSRLCGQARSSVVPAVPTVSVSSPSPPNTSYPGDRSCLLPSLLRVTQAYNAA